MTTNRDHAPSKVLLDKPYPANMPLMKVCQPCNSGFAEDEEYVAGFLGALLSGSTEPEAQLIERSAHIFRSNPQLRSRVEKAKHIDRDLFGEETMLWLPELPRFENVLVKNARGHAYYEISEPLLEAPSGVWFGPLASLTSDQTASFEDIPWPDGLLPEVGSRMMSRFLTGDDLDDGWVIVQEGVYRYAVMQTGGMVVRIVMREYLAAEIMWE
ncbi:hypothetical protein LB535_06315 [Mesorhizobium sp. CA10]|uniref:hypothetical protein n=1 Tax=Mesorhizobium sp. CA10 TaxID=588495 RepID=UPI001CCE6811|nr:hypothetical protein [Mesorhizobium sp. CA10]MBZ9881962.1 hypothetical protein [Mesorhizobium sp. CA10]